MLNRIKDERCKEVLLQDKDELERLLRLLKSPIRKRRSIDFIGSAIKFIAGTPDHQDMEMLKLQEDELTRSTNRQIDINTQIQNKLDEITDTINNLNINALGKQGTADNYEKLTSIMSRRNRIIINNLSNNIYSLILAKNNIVNPLILSIEEIELIEMKENIVTEISDLLNVADVKMYYQNDTLVYLIKIPKVQEICQYFEISPVIYDNKILDLSSNRSANCKKINYPLSTCKKAPIYSYCKIDHQNSCLSHLLNNNTAQCPTTHADHIQKIEVVADGIIIARDKNITVEERDQRIVLNGSFLITYDTKIKINGREYSTDKPLIANHLPAPKITVLNESAFNEKISLPYLHKLHFVNNQQIKEFKATLETTKWTWYGVTGILVTIILVLLYAKLKPKKVTITTNADPGLSSLDKDLMKMRVLRIMNEDVQI